MTQKQKALGFGGLFFRAKDPAALAKWYETHLGINPVPTSMEDKPWVQAAGPTVFAPFPVDTDYFGEDPSKQFMLNFRVADLDAIVTELQAAGVAVRLDPDNPHPQGRFARLYDPEMNPIELWEPAA